MVSISTIVLELVVLVVMCGCKINSTWLGLGGESQVNCYGLEDLSDLSSAWSKGIKTPEEEPITAASPRCCCSQYRVYPGVLSRPACNRGILSPRQGSQLLQRPVLL